MVTITNTPEQFTPANNPIIFNLSSNSSSLVLFQVTLVQAPTGTVIYTGNVYPTPLNPSAAGINLQKQLASLVNCDVDNQITFIMGKPNNAINYQLQVQDYGVTGGTLTPLTTGTTSSSVLTAYEAQFDNFNYNNLALYTYLLSADNYNNQSFMTLQPDYKPVNDYSAEQLYFIQDGTFSGLTINLAVNGTSAYNYPYISTVIPATSASVTINYTGSPATSAVTSIQIIQPTVSHIIYSGTVSYSGGINAYLTALAPLINSNAYGYSATVVSTSALTITAPLSLGSTMNTYPCYVSFNSGNGYFGTFSGGTTATYTPLDRITRINTSPSMVTDYIDIYAGDTYSVSLQDMSGNTISETRTYVYEDADCLLNYMNVLFTNSVGGVDCIQLIQPVESIDVTKLKIKKNNIDVNSPDFPLMTNQGIYNVQNLTYDYTSKSSVKAYTKTMSNDYSKWLIELVKSKNIYIETNVGNLIPVQLKSTTFNIDQTRFKPNEPIIYQFEFVFDDDFNPSTSTGESIIANN